MDYQKNLLYFTGNGNAGLLGLGIFMGIVGTLIYLVLVALVISLL